MPEAALGIISTQFLCNLDILHVDGIHRGKSLVNVYKRLVELGSPSRGNEHLSYQKNEDGKNSTSKSVTVIEQRNLFPRLV